MKLINGDCLEQLKALKDNSVDSIVTDPPYGLSFMGKKWDYDVPSVGIWQEVYRVLKPGGHILSFAGSRTYHRMAVNIEDAGFEIRDQIMWVYGSGFPKSLNIGKKIKEYEGWGTALKPAHEPIVLARKSLSEKTVAENVLKWGTGGLNIDGSRVPANYSDSETRTSKTGVGIWNKGSRRAKEDGEARHNPQGRFPANFIHDGIETEWARFFYCAKASKKERGEGNNHPTVKPIALMKYLIKLITPTNGTVLDPFMGSGTTGIAAKEEGFDFVGIELDEDYYKIAENRIENL